MEESEIILTWSEKNEKQKNGLISMKIEVLFEDGSAFNVSEDFCKCALSVNRMGKLPSEWNFDEKSENR